VQRNQASPPQQDSPWHHNCELTRPKNESLVVILKSQGLGKPRIHALAESDAPVPEAGHILLYQDGKSSLICN